jgi:PEP-CTERM motif
MKIRKLFLAAIATLAFVGVGQAQILDVSFTGAQSSAFGQIDVVNGIAISGSLTVTSGTEQGTYNLVTLNSPLINGDPADNGAIQTLRISGGNDQIFDNAVAVGADPFLTNDGLEFANDTTIGFNLFSNSPGSYTLYHASAIQYVIDTGTATATAAVPEPSVWALMLAGLGFLALARYRSRQA